ncbi:uncharacterized protein LOC126700039 [Quercus robur]|uniref:uncharacterized protein LOC126700039 n=1 Tax=Quercus robur TaxID=38942 RepID=UPI002162CC48|nr:uncharacterized protein LOC126700039 [Quercus robur]
MGGCAGKPKHSDVHKESIPTEDPAHANKAEGEAIPQESQNGGESQKEAPLVDLSNPKEEETKEKASEPKTDEAVPVSVEAGKETAKTTEGKVEVPAANNSEEKKVKAGDETKKPVEGQAEANVQKPDANNKSDAPLATV